jgi:hypothetical protein
MPNMKEPAVVESENQFFFLHPTPISVAGQMGVLYFVRNFNEPVDCVQVT